MLITMKFKNREILRLALDRLEALTKSAQSALEKADLSTLSADEQLAVLDVARQKIPDTKNDWDITMRITSLYRDSLFALGAECRKAETIQSMLRELGDQRDIFAESNIKPGASE